MASTSPHPARSVNADAAAAFIECERLVATRDEDRWIGARYAPPEKRKALFALYAFLGELDRIPHLVSEPPLGEMRLQWWREALAAGARGGQGLSHPVVSALHAADLCAREAVAIGASLDARARLLYGEPFRSADELAKWTRHADAAIDVAAVRTLAPLSADAAEAVADCAVAYALARRKAVAGGVDVAPVAAALRAASRSVLRALPPAAAPALAPFALTNRYLYRSRLSPAEKRLRIFVAIATGRF